MSIPRKAAQQAYSKQAGWSGEEPPEVHRRNSIYVGMLVVICALELWGLSQYFPPDAWLNVHPFYTDSYALHFARGLIGEAALVRHLRLWSYSPNLMAGYPAGTRTEPMGAAPAMWFWVCGGFFHELSLEQAAVLYKLMVVGLLAAVPPAMALAALWLGFDLGVAVLSAVLGTLGVFNYPGILMMRVGMFGFLSASYMSVAWGAFLYRTLQAGRAWRFALLAAAGGAITYLHPFSAFLLVPPALAGLAMSRGSRRGALAISLASSFVLSLGWFGPLLLTLAIGVHFAKWWQSAPTIIAGLQALYRFRLPFPPLALAAAAAYGALYAPVHRKFKGTWLAATFAFAALAYFASLVPVLADIEPLRMEAPFYFYAVPFAAFGVYRGWCVLGLMRAGWRLPIKVLAAGFATYCGMVSLASLWLESRTHGPIATALPPAAAEIENWMNRIGRDSRLILESGWTIGKHGEVRPLYFDADLTLLWTLESGREVIGGSSSEGFSTFSFVDFGNGMAFGRPLKQWTPKELRNQLDIYNVGELILWSDNAKQYMSQVPDVKLLLENEPYALYGVEGVRSYLLAGDADSVKATQDCIEISDAQPGRLILKYHYFRTMRAAPPMPISPAAIGNGDPNPFVQIDNDSLRDIRIYNAGFTGLGRLATACPHLVSHNRNKFSVVDAAFDLTGGLGPDEGLGVLDSSGRGSGRWHAPVGQRW